MIPEKLQTHLCLHLFRFTIYKIQYNQFQVLFLILFSFVIIIPTTYAQQNKDILSSYENYFGLSRELIYSHLNKSNYIKGETIGFTNYILDKDSKQLFDETKNLYCVLTDENNTVIKEKLLLVKNGVSHGIFNIDSLFTSGTYTFKAYTNWSRNFDERNYYTQQIKIIDPAIEKVIKPLKVTPKIDAQFLPEGGHFVADIPNVTGVVIKDRFGFGVPDLTGVLKDSDGTILKEFKVNHLGIGRFTFSPQSQKTYTATITNHGVPFTFNIENISQKGINLKLVDRHSKVALSFQTNLLTHETIKKQQYQLLLHNGERIKKIPVSFKNSTEVTTYINYKDLFSGINIFTLFDENNNPVLERLFFNHEGIQHITSNDYNVSHHKDSIEISLNFDAIDSHKFNNLSISVLPDETKSYTSHHNMMSSTLLRPYVKGPVENARYYFQKPNAKKKYELDNLLLTQGWSAYNWDHIFNHPPTNFYRFDEGISFKAKVEKNKNQKFLVHPINGSKPETFDISEEDDGFLVTDKFPIKNDLIRISKVKNKGTLIPSDVSLDFYPNHIPEFTRTNPLLGVKVQQLLKETEVQPFALNFDKMEQLDEIEIKGYRSQERMEQIKIKHQGQVDFFDEKHVVYPDFESYIMRYGFQFLEIDGQTIFVNPTNKKTPSVYFDHIRMRDWGALRHTPLVNIDYISINRHKADFSDRREAAVGIIKVVTLPTSEVINRKRVHSRHTGFTPPLTFDSNKTFYTPVYNSYHNSFFKEYGVIGWFPENEVDENGMVKFKIYNNNISNLKVGIEGISNDGTFISEIKTISLEMDTFK